MSIMGNQLHKNSKVLDKISAITTPKNHHSFVTSIMHDDPIKESNSTLDLKMKAIHFEKDY